MASSDMLLIGLIGIDSAHLLFTGRGAEVIPPSKSLPAQAPCTYFPASSIPPSTSMFSFPQSSLRHPTVNTNNHSIDTSLPFRPSCSNTLLSSRGGSQATRLKARTLYPIRTQETQIAPPPTRRAWPDRPSATTSLYYSHNSNRLHILLPTSLSTSKRQVTLPLSRLPYKKTLPPIPHSSSQTSILLYF